MVSHKLLKFLQVQQHKMSNKLYLLTLHLKTKHIQQKFQHLQTQEHTQFTSKQMLKITKKRLEVLSLLLAKQILF